MKTKKPQVVNLEPGRVIRTFRGENYAVAVFESGDVPRLGYERLRPAIPGTGCAEAFTAKRAFERSRLLRLAASFAEWIEDHGIETSREWPGDAGSDIGRGGVS